MEEQWDREGMRGMAESESMEESCRVSGEDSMEKRPAEEIRISVRNLVEFILRHGDIDNRHRGTPEGAMQEGSRIHRMIQKRMGAEYRAEVPLKYTLAADGYTLMVEGRADGIIHHEGKVTIDEIKGTYRELARIGGPEPLHLAQAKCYAYMYGLGQGLGDVRVQITYCNIPAEELKYFHREYDFGELETWFAGVIAAYQKWADYSCKWRGIRQNSIEGLAFPYPYRAGQKELAANVYRTIYHGKKLFLEAPTGVGKTISTIYPSVQAMGKGMGEKLFYLTAKTITRTVAEETLQLLREKGLRMKSIILTAKEKICFMAETECNPEYCPYAKGHYDRVNEAVFDLLTSEESFNRGKIEEYAGRYRVCPFEMCLDASLFADAIICDYNYLFDPHVYLKRFFAEGIQGNYIFLIDEAHNLLDRGREMYSAELRKEQFTELRRELKKTLASEKGKKQKKTHVSKMIETPINTVISEQMSLDMTQNMTCDMTLESENGESLKLYFGHGRKSVLVRRGYAEKLISQLNKCNRELLAMKRECERCLVVESIESFLQMLLRLHGILEDYFAEQEDSPVPQGEMLLDFYFEVRHFLLIYDLLDENYVKYTQTGEDGSFRVKLFCVNPRENLKNCMLRGRSAILFSATFLPIQYYKKLLGGDPEDFEVYAHSVFDPARRALLIAEDVTSKYTRRSEEEYDRIAWYIEEIVKNRHGNYMVFCPSHAFMNRVYEKYVDNFAGAERQCIIQGESMSEADREAFLQYFRRTGAEESTGQPPGQRENPMDAEKPDITGQKGNPAGTEDMDFPGKGSIREQGDQERDRMLVGFCVLGGIFSEGIDLKGDSLIGVIIVGTGLPQVSDERGILKAYFDENGEDGFAYAFRYPGMNKVLQAAGRVIRTVEDVGIIALLDERFLQFSYRRLFPREWENFETVSVNRVAKRVERFWDEWL